MPSTPRAPAVDQTPQLQAEALLLHTYRWLQAATPAAPQLSTAIPATVTAVQLYEARQIPACLKQITGVLGTLRQARPAGASLPPL
jgi:hypothetical protein